MELQLILESTMGATGVATEAMEDTTAATEEVMAGPIPTSTGHNRSARLSMTSLPHKSALLCLKQSAEP